MTDREKTIAEIREKYNRTFGNVTGQMVLTHEQVQFLLSELDRIEREYAEERAAHNEHVAELCELEKENRRLREDIEKIIKILKNGQPAHWQAFKIRQLLGVTME